MLSKTSFQFEDDLEPDVIQCPMSNSRTLCLKLSNKCFKLAFEHAVLPTKSKITNLLK